MLIHHGALDTRLVEAYPDYEAAMQANNVTYEGHIYPNSVHGFFNDATPERYNTGRGGGGLDAHDRVVQSIYAGGGLRNRRWTI